MPKQYEAMKAKFIKDGMSEKAAEGKAARIYNAGRGSKPPVTRGSDKKKKK